MFAIKKFSPASRVIILVSILCLLITAAPALAGGGGGQVLPPKAKPHGYSLVDAAAATAYFNLTPGRPPDAIPQNFPFQILYDSPSNPSHAFSVKAGTMFYVPNVNSDSADAALWPFPDVTDSAAVSAYYFDPQQLGAEFVRIVVDGKTTNLGPAYAVGAKTPGLPTGGNSYTVVAAFLSPLSPGVHTVEIKNRFTGAFIAMYPDFFPGGVFETDITYTVTVH